MSSLKDATFPHFLGAAQIFSCTAFLSDSNKTAPAFSVSPLLNSFINETKTCPRPCPPQKKELSFSQEQNERNILVVQVELQLETDKGRTLGSTCSLICHMEFGLSRCQTEAVPAQGKILQGRCASPTSACTRGQYCSCLSKARTEVPSCFLNEACLLSAHPVQHHSFGEAACSHLSALNTAALE